MNPSVVSKKAKSLQEALVHLEQAIALLDGADAPGQIGAQADLAACQLRRSIEVEPMTTEIWAPIAY